MKMNYNIIMVLIIIVLLHYSIINGLEKMLFNIYFTDKSNILRPLETCHKLRNPPVKCLGMPSGHTELTTLVLYILYKYKYISLPIVFILIIAMCIQRVVFKRHTILQTIVGVIFGFIYGLMYYNIKNNYVKVGLALCIIFLYTNIILYKITKKLNEPIPGWVDKKMYSTIEKKNNIHYYIKFFSIIIPSILQTSILYISWYDLEYYLDEIIKKIKNTNQKYDGIVGIKSGGAIISDYISKKLNIQNYKIKLKEKEYGCNPPRDIISFIKTYYKKNIIKDNNYVICQDINDDLTNKNIILIDEVIYKGITMKSAIKYLNKKKVNKIYPVVINNPKINNDKVNSLVNSYYIYIWPWGYDN